MTWRERVDAWRSRPARERWAIGLPAAALALAVLWLAVLEPMQAAALRLRAALPQLEVRRERLRGESAEVRNARPAAPVPAAGIAQIRTVLDRRQIPASAATVEPAGEGRFRIALSRAPFHALWPALQALQNELGLRVITLQVDRLDAAAVRVEAVVGAGER